MCLRLPEIMKMFENIDCHIYKHNISPGCSQIFLALLEAFRYNTISEYGLPGLRKSRNHQIWRF